MSETVQFVQMKAPRHFIREWRKYRGLTMEQLAMRLDISAAAISRVERGEQRYNQELLEALARALECSPADLIVRNPAGPEDLATALGRLGPAGQAVALKVIEALAPNELSDGAHAEAAVIGLMMYEPVVARLLNSSALSRECFGDEFLASVYEIISYHVEKGAFSGVPDPATVEEWIKSYGDEDPGCSSVADELNARGGLPYLVELVANSPPSSRLSELAGEIAAAEVRRSLKVLRGH